jgi:hypothetical protein
LGLGCKSSDERFLFVDLGKMLQRADDLVLDMLCRRVAVLIKSSHRHRVDTARLRPEPHIKLNVGLRPWTRRVTIGHCRWQAKRAQEEARTAARAVEEAARREKEEWEREEKMRQVL